MEKFNGIFLRVCLSAIPIIGIGWILAVTDYFGVALTFQQVIAVVLGLACACAFLTYPYFEKPGLLEIALSLIAFFSWFWMHGGQTLGMKAWRMQLRNHDGGPVQWHQAILRYLTAWVSWLSIVGMLWCVVDAQRRSLQDIVSRTELVVQPRQR